MVLVRLMTRRAGTGPGVRSRGGRAGHRGGPANNLPGHGSNDAAMVLTGQCQPGRAATASTRRTACQCMTRTWTRPAAQGPEPLGLWPAVFGPGPKDFTLQVGQGVHIFSYLPCEFHAYIYCNILHINADKYFWGQSIFLHIFTNFDLHIYSYVYSSIERIYLHTKHIFIHILKN